MYQSRLLSFLMGAALCIVACSGADSGPETETESSESGSTVTETPSGTLPRIDTGSLSPKSPKLGTGEYNPLVDSRFMADPTAVEYDGRLYVYATDDHRWGVGVLQAPSPLGPWTSPLGVQPHRRK